MQYPDYSLLTQSLVGAAINVLMVVGVLGALVCIGCLVQANRATFSELCRKAEERWLRIAAQSSDAQLACAMFRLGIARGSYESFTDAERRLEHVAHSRRAAILAVEMSARSTVAELPPLNTWVDESGIVHLRTNKALPDEVRSRMEEAASIAADGAVVRVHDTERPPAPTPHLRRIQ